MAIVIGIFMAFVSNYLLAYIAGGVTNELWLSVSAWRWMYGVEAVPALLYGIGALLIPESPRFLVQQGRDEEAAIVLERVGEPDVPMRLREIRRTVDSDHKPRLSDLLGPNGLPQRIVVVGMLLSAFQQFVGINVIFYYGAVLWSAVGLSEQNSLLINIITGTVNVGSTVVAIMFVDRVGRRPLLLAGSVGMAITLGLMSFLFSGAPVGADGNLQLTRTVGIVALVAANMFVFSFGVSWGPVVWVMLGEMFNNRIRALALAIGAAVQWIANFAITMTFPLMLHGLGLGFAYGIYAAAAVLSGIFVLTMVKETKGMALEDM
jgi:sugar porter (SP) family MFS transporter